MKEINEQRDLIPPGRKMLSKSAYAAHRGVSPAAVTRALREGRIRATVIDGREVLDVLSADASWDMSSRPRRDALPPPPRGAAVSQPSGGGDLNRQLKEAALSLQLAKAEQANLDLDRAAGLLVERAAVEAVLADLGATLRSLLDSLPFRAAPSLARHRGDAEAIHVELQSIAANLLEELVAHMHRKMEALQ